VSNVACTECGAEIGHLTKYLAGKWAGDCLELFWACEHFPAAEAPVRLASKECVEKFITAHPEYRERIIELMSAYERDCNHPLVM